DHAARGREGDLRLREAEKALTPREQRAQGRSVPMSAAGRRPVRERPSSPRLRPVDEGAQRHRSPTAVAAEALRTGVLPVSPDARRWKIPGADETLRVGEPDDD